MVSPSLLLYRREREALKASAEAPPIESGVPRAQATPSASGREIHVLPVDDHTIVRQGPMGLLRQEADIEVIAEAADGQQAIELALRNRPEVVVMDISMSILNGIEATRRIAAELPGTQIIGLSMYEAADQAEAMLEAGAMAYLSKGGPSQDLIAAIRASAASWNFCGISPKADLRLREPSPRRSVPDNPRLRAAPTLPGLSMRQGCYTGKSSR